MSSAQHRSVRLAVLVMFVFASSLLAGCGLFGGAETQTITDPSSIYHFKVPASWTTTSSPGMITIYGGEEMPSVDSAIDKEPWFFVLRSTSTESDLDEILPALAKARSESRNWKNVTLGKPVKTTLGKATAYEMDIKATDEQKRSFEGKLLLARRGGNDVLVFAFTKPGAFERSGYDDLKSDFYWLVGEDSEMNATQTAEPAEKDSEKKE